MFHFFSHDTEKIDRFFFLTKMNNLFLLSLNWVIATDCSITNSAVMLDEKYARQSVFDWQLGSFLSSFVNLFYVLEWIKNKKKKSTHGSEIGRRSRKKKRIDSILTIMTKNDRAEEIVKYERRIVGIWH
jgi:hypothetical protein